jgi:hypothetical protein
MKFTLLIAAQLYAQKVNLELTFPTFPSIGDVIRQIETTFSIESSALRPPGEPFAPFRVDRLQIFDDRLAQWVDLLATNQLVEFGQVYAFQRDAPATEVQQQIPPARLPSSRASAGSPTRRGGAPVATSPIRPLAASGSLPYAERSYASASSAARHVSPPRATSPRRGLAPLAARVSHKVTNPRASFATSQASVNQRMPENPSHETKLRLTFDEMDLNKNRVVEMEEFRRTFAALKVDFSAATVSDLFGRADSDRDGVVSFHDFSNFGMNYPTLLDSLYFRFREQYEEGRRKQVVDSQNAALEEARRRQEQSRLQADDARRDLDNQEKSLVLQEQDMQARLLKERDCRTSQMDAKKESERSHYDRTEKERDLVAGREREHQRHGGVVEAQRAVEGAERRMAGQESELHTAQEKERQLEALLAEARRESERQRTALQAAGAELGQWRDREQQALGVYADAQREVQRLADSLNAAELEHARRIEKEREADAFLAEAQRDAARAAQRRDEEERELQIQREREMHMQRLLQDAVRQAEDQHRALRALEQDMVDYLQRRLQIQEQEMPLLEQEVRLREQRYNLEERETKLRSETQSFSITIGRGPATGSSFAAFSPSSASRRPESASFAVANSSPRRSPPRRAL